MNPNVGLLAGLLSGAAGEVDNQRQQQRGREDDEMNFRRHVLDTMMQSVAQGNSPPEYLPRILQDYAKTNKATPRSRQSGKAGFMGATQLPDLSTLMTGGMGGPGSQGQPGPSQAGPQGGAAPSGGGAGAPQPSAPPPGPIPNPAGTGGMAEAAGGLAGLIPPQQGAGGPAPSSPAMSPGGAPPPALAPSPDQGPTSVHGLAQSVAGQRSGPTAVPPPPPPSMMMATPGPNDAFRYYTPQERAQMGTAADVAKRNAEEQSDVDQMRAAGASEEEIKRAILMKHGMKAMPASRAIRTWIDQKTHNPVTWNVDPWTQEPVDSVTRVPIDLNEQLEGGGARYIPAPQMGTAVNANGDVSQVSKSPYTGGASVTPMQGGRGAAKGFAPMYTFEKDTSGQWHAANRRTGTMNQAGTGVTGTVPQGQSGYDESAVTAAQALKEVQDAINQDMRANPSANPAELREQYAKQIGFPSFTELQKAATKSKVKKPVTPPTGGGAKFSPDNPFAKQ